MPFKLDVSLVYNTLVQSSIGEDLLIFATEMLLSRTGHYSVFRAPVLLSLGKFSLTFAAEMLLELDVSSAFNVLVQCSADHVLNIFAAELLKELSSCLGI